MFQFLRKAHISKWAIFGILILALFLSSGGAYFFGQKSATYAYIVNLPLEAPLPLIKPTLSDRREDLPVIRGIGVDIANVLLTPSADLIGKINFYIDTMDKAEVKKKDIERFIKYFLGFLAIPRDKLWVNLSPYEKDRMIEDSLARLDVGKDMLLEDYMLKQLTASLTDPKTSYGKKFWKKVYRASYKISKTTKIPISTFHKIWIVPETAVVCEQTTAVSKIPPFFALQKMARSRHFAKQNDGQKSKIKMTNQKYKNAPKPKTYNPKPNVKFFIKEARLKVMLEEDYYAQAQISNSSRDRPKACPRGAALPQTRLTPLSNTIKFQYSNSKSQKINKEAKEIFKRDLLPLIEKEINESVNFAPLRQMYYALILAQHFKEKLKENLVYRNYIDGEEASPIALSDAQKKKEIIYQTYLKSFKEGVYSYLKKEYDPYMRKKVIRRYISGGEDFSQLSIKKEIAGKGKVKNIFKGKAREIEVEVRGRETKNIRYDLISSLPKEAQVVSYRELRRQINHLLKGKLKEGESFHYQMEIENGDRVEVTGINVPKEAASELETLTEKEIALINKNAPAVTKDKAKPYLSVRISRGKDAIPMQYIAAVPTPQGMRLVKARKKAYLSPRAEELEREIINLLPGAEVKEKKRFDKRGFYQLMSYMGGYYYRRAYLKNANKLEAFILTMEKLNENVDKEYFVTAGNFQVVLADLGYRVGHISSYYKMYEHYKELEEGIDIGKRFGELLEESEEELNAFIALMKELKEKDKNYKLLNASNLEGVLVGLGYKVSYIDSCYNLWEHYKELEEGIDIGKRFGELLEESEGKLIAFRALLTELWKKDKGYKPLNASNLQGVLNYLGYKDRYIASYYNLYEHYKGLEKGIDIEKRFGELLEESEGKLIAFRALLTELWKKDKGYKPLNARSFQGVLEGLGYRVRYIASCYKIYEYWKKAVFDIGEAFDQGFYYENKTERQTINALAEKMLAKRIGLPKGKFSLSLKAYIYLVLQNLGKIEKKNFPRVDFEKIKKFMPAITKEESYEVKWSLDELREQGVLNDKEYELGILSMLGYNDEGLKEGLKVNAAELKELKQTLGEKLIRTGVVSRIPRIGKNEEAANREELNQKMRGGIDFSLNHAGKLKRRDSQLPSALSFQIIRIQKVKDVEKLLSVVQ